MREKLVSGGLHIPFDDFFIPYTTTVSLNWPYSDEEVFARGGASNGGIAGAVPGEMELVPSAKYEEHMYNLANWSLGPAFAKAHPGLADTIRVAEGGRKG